MHDAIIVGGGPAGALAAILMARSGARVALLEAEGAVRRKVCGEYLCPRGVELLEGLGLAPIAVGRPITGMRIVSPRGQVVAARFPASRGRLAIGLALNRSVFEAGLLEAARVEGASVRMGARVSGVSRAARGWRVELRDGASLEGALLVGADGRRSIVARALGLSVPSSSDRIALHGHFHAAEPTSSFGEMHVLDDGSYIGVDPTGDHEVNVSLVCSAASVRAHGGARGALAHHLRAAADYRARHGDFPAGAPLRGVSPITHLVRSPVAPSAALVGDAAGFLDPLTGEGIYQALFGARALAEALSGERSFGPAALERALCRYARARERELGLKRRLNACFQWAIRRPSVVEGVARTLTRKARRADAFLGTIGNVYGPVEGLVRTFTP